MTTKRRKPRAVWFLFCCNGSELSYHGTRKEAMQRKQDFASSGYDYLMPMTIVKYTREVKGRKK